MRLREKLSKAAEEYCDHPEESLRSVRRIMNENDTVEFSAEHQRILIAQRLGSEAVELTRVDGQVSVADYSMRHTEPAYSLDITI